ncbi:uncharacterized protein LOC115232248 [Octopus sinensis]|uniref:Uncharacterized protein LOC115232248 n=1 Tax=Octopus sinensis TaxID=2607531 RepID=A0A6P7U9A9_9MOLL|nr:uncharacterized protein LOC115232248 [Octopus sinensis]
MNVRWFHGVMVSTLDFESSDRSSNLEKDSSDIQAPVRSSGPRPIYWLNHPASMQQKEKCIGMEYQWAPGCNLRDERLGEPIQQATKKNSKARIQSACVYFNCPTSMFFAVLYE